ncbi:branched-chain amino acid ABC transporter permease [Schauerella aestuarii]|uniref:branched-chain amino acid ABC transporter permease n=1 Tax=Schauerella aestuarii TaxID=2511204 RepID=UPI00136D1C9E|nr:branched-chain amino acid ABC transporter permease [Achromobacter aestuarii]MYZ45041.1 branched-chain amino acid ABC transporter permease [Achromobacter aestuarii]
MAYTVVQILNALSFSVLLLLTGLGLSLVLSLMNFVNLTHGSFYLLGSYIGIQWLASGAPWYLAFPAAFVITGAVGWLLDRYPFRGFYPRTHLMQVLLTYGLSVVFADLMRWGFGADTRTPDLPEMLSGVAFIMGFPFPIYRLFIIGAGLILALVLWLLIDRTLWGAAIRACTVDRAIVETLGIDTRKLLTAGLVLAAGLGGLGGALGAGMLSAYPGLDEEVLLLALLVVVVGGLGSFAGTVASALLIGFVTTFGRMWVPEFANFVTLGLMALILVMRPVGLLGREARQV